MNENLLNNLVCPITNTRLEWDRENNRLINRESNIVYPIEHGIAIMLPERSEKLNK